MSRSADLPPEAPRAATGPGARSRSLWRTVGRKAGVAVLTVAGIILVVRLAPGGVPHPDPRLDLPAAEIRPTSRYEGYPRVARAYAMAAAVPDIVDGLYCHCHCAEHSSHYSLLECFQTDHAARCDICMSEATIAYEMTRDGTSLDAIRDEVDRTFGR